jgi:hypothetical protein
MMMVVVMVMMVMMMVDYTGDDTGSPVAVQQAKDM